MSQNFADTLKINWLNFISYKFCPICCYFNHIDDDEVYFGTSDDKYSEFHSRILCYWLLQPAKKSLPLTPAERYCRRMLCVFLCGLRDRCDRDATDAALRRFVPRSAFRMFVNIRHISSLNAVELNMISRRSWPYSFKAWLSMPSLVEAGTQGKDNDR